ncbi:MAG: hypothetical protein JKY09_01655 [Crocinitomicaceae bacterium]|nr:hypothetical protein [Crocinitomicaceae bacterium]
MTLDGFFRGLGDIFQLGFQWLQNDFWFVGFMNYGTIVLGFIGLFYWLNLQNKMNIEADNNPDQIK